MKKLTYILKNHITDRIIAVTSLVALMLCTSSSAWGTTYYLIGSSSSDDPAQWSKLAENTSTEFTVSLAHGNNYMAISTSQSIANYESASGKSYSFSSDDAWNFQTKNWGVYYYVWANVKNADTYTISYDGNTYTLTRGGGPVATNYYCVGSVSPWNPWCVTTDCDAANILSLQDGYYTKTFRKVAGDLRFRLKNATGNAGWMTMAYDESSPTNLNGITTQGTSDDDLTLSGVRGTHNMQTGFDFTIKYDASTNKTYLITTPYIFFKGPIFNKGNWDDDYSASCWEWTNISKVGDNWVFTYDWTINSTGLGTKLFTVCTTTNEDSGFKLPNYESEVTLVDVKRNWNGSNYNYEPDISIAEGDNLRLRVTRYGPEDYKVELINLDVSTPAVRIGKKLTEVTAEGVTQGDVRVSAYIAATGCANVNKVKIFYANNSSFRNGEGYKSASVEKTLASAVTANNQCAEDLYLTAAQVSSVVGKGETLYVRVKAINANDVSSAYSDVAKLTYQYDKFIVANQTIADATACEGKHEFKWTGEGGMFNPVPDGYTVKYDNASGSDASSEFTIVGDKMVWSDLSKYDDDASSEVHTYYFTASKEGYTSTSATATFTLTATALEGVAVTILENGDPVTEVISADPWVEKTFTATRSDSNSGILWECPDNATLKVSDNGATVVFKGEKPSTTPYIIKARAANASCGRSEKTEAGIMVDVITETCSN